MPKARGRRRSPPRRRQPLAPRAVVTPVALEAPPLPSTESLVIGELKKIGIISGGIIVLLVILFFLWR